MEIKFTFVYNTKNNSFFLKKPNKKSKKYQKIILKNFKDKNYQKIPPEKRVTIELGETLQIYMIKKNPNYMFGLLGEKKTTRTAIYKFLQKFHKKFQYLQKNKINMKKDKSIIIWLKNEMQAFKEGKRLTKGEEILIKTRSATVKIENQVLKAEFMNLQLIQTLDETEEMKEAAIESKAIATEVKNEAWWYNQQLTIFIFGLVGIFVLVFGLWFIHVVL